MTIERIREATKLLKRDVVTLWLAARDPRVPIFAKLIAAAVAAYGLSPIDLIPDFIPVLGLVDDLIILPAGIWLASKLIPADVLDELRARAAAIADRPTSIAGAIAIVVIWLLILAWAWYLLAR